MTCTHDGDNQTLRQRLYDGDIVRLSATTSSRRLTAAMRSLLKTTFQGAYRKAQFKYPVADFFDKISAVRKAILDMPQWQKLQLEVLASAGFEPGANAIDGLRLRAVTDGGHNNPKAAAAYSVHRDTWYASPQSQINWWIPLDDLTEEETFWFFPDYFRNPVENQSGSFDYDTFMGAAGWQSAASSQQAVYPTVVNPMPKTVRAEGFSCRSGEIILFSASQLHQTRPNCSGLTRFSLDFRTVHLADDAAGLGAPNVDNASTGSSLKDFRTGK